MADSNIQLNTDGTGKKLDTRTESTNLEHRQVIVIGDPATNAGVAPVDATKGLAVDLTNTGANTTALKVDASATTQPVSAAALPLPSGAATAAKQPALGTAGTASSDVITVQGIASGTAQPVSAASLPLPTGAATSANQTTELASLATIATNTGAATPAGSAIIGKVGIDQTTPGTTNGVTVTDGTNTANVVAGDTGFNGVATASATKTYTFTTSSSGAQTILANTNVEGYSWMEIVYTSVGVGLALNGQFSTISGGTYVNSLSFTNGSLVPNLALGTSASTIYSGPVRGNFFQIAVSALTSGTFTGTLTLRANAPIPVTTPVNGVVGSNSATGSAVPANAFYMGLNNGGNLNGAGAVTSGDAIGGTGTLGVGNYVFNGTNYDRNRSATAAANTTGTGLLGAGALAVAATALPSAATATNYVRAMADKFGRLVTVQGTVRDLVGTQTTTISASTSETTIVTAAASTFNDLTALVLSNTSATATRIDFRDTTAGSILFSVYVPAGDVRGVAFNRPVPQTSVNTNWTAQSSTSVTDLRVYAVFDKNA